MKWLPENSATERNKNRTNRGGNDIQPEVDQISQLPDDVLVSIISRLSPREAAITSVLSTRWKYLWTYITRLSFLISEREAKIRMFERDLTREEKQNHINRVNHVLNSHKGGFLEKFQIELPLDDHNNYCEVDKWIKYALSRQVQTLEIKLIHKSYYQKQYNLPTYEDLNRNSFKSSSPSFFKSLKSLCLESVGVDDQMAKFLLYSGCPLLERLSIRESKQLKNLDVTGPSIKLMYLELCLMSMNSIRICNVTSLVSFRIRGISDIHSGRLVLENLPSLVEVDTAAHIGGNMWILAPAMSSFLDQLVKFTLAIYQGSMLSFDWHVRRFTGMKKLKVLKLEIEATSNDPLIYLVPLIIAAPNLEKLVIQNGWTDHMADERDVMFTLFKHYREELQMLRSFCSSQIHEHLKIVHFYGYFDRGSDRELATYLLKHTVALEKFIVRPPFRTLDRDNRRYTKNVRVAREAARRDLQGITPRAKGAKLVIL